MTESIHRAIRRILNQIKLPFQALVKVSGGTLSYTVKAGLTRSSRKDLEALQHYGLVSRLPVGTKVIVLPRLGRTEKLVIISEAHKTALSLSEGDVALERESGEHVFLKDGAIEVNAASGVVNITGGTVNLAGSEGKALATEDLLTLFNAHTHIYSPGPGGPVPTAPPAMPAVAEKTIKTKAL